MNELIVYTALTLIVCILLAVVMFVSALHKEIIKDKNKNFVPDKVEDVVKEAQERVDNAVDALKGKK